MLNDGNLIQNVSHPVGPAWGSSQASAPRSPTASIQPLSQEDFSEAALREAIESLCSGGGVMSTAPGDTSLNPYNLPNSWQSAGGPKEICSTPSTVADVLLAAPPGYHTPPQPLMTPLVPQPAWSPHHHRPSLPFDSPYGASRQQPPQESSHAHPYNCSTPQSIQSCALPSQDHWPQQTYSTRSSSDNWGSASRLQSLELDELSRHLTDALQQHREDKNASCALAPKSSSTDIISSNLLASDTRSEVISGTLTRGNPTKLEDRSVIRNVAYSSAVTGNGSVGGGYSASLVVPSRDRYCSRFVRGDDLSSSLVGSDVPTELKLDTASCLHPEGHACYAYGKKMTADFTCNDDDDDDDDDEDDECDPSGGGSGDHHKDEDDRTETSQTGQSTSTPSGGAAAAAAARTTKSSCSEKTTTTTTKEPTTPGKSTINGNTPVHSVPPASLACRKRLTLTGSRGTKCLRKLMSRLNSAVAIGDWNQALLHTRTFAMCNESDSDDEITSEYPIGGEAETDTATVSVGEQANSDNEAERNDYEVADDCEWPISSKFAMLRPSDVMNYCDFVNMCASCFHGLPSKEIGLPKAVDDATIIRDGAKDIRQLLCDVETILLMCLASKVDLEPSEKLKLKNVVASLVFLLAWHPAMIEAIAVIFVKLQSQTNNDCFCSFLSRWTFTTNAIQILFEVFCLLLIRQKRYLAFLLVLSATERGGSFIKPLLADPCVEAQISTCLPEAGPIISAHAVVIESLRVPSYAISIFLHDFIVASSKDKSTTNASGGASADSSSSSLIPHLEHETVILSIMPLILARPFSDEMLISRGWHYRLMLFGSPVESFTPTEILALLRAQTRQVETNLLAELEFGARAVVMHAVPHYLLLGSEQIRTKAYAMFEQSKPPAYFEDLRPILQRDAFIEIQPTDHPEGHLPFERLYRNAMVKAGGYFLTDCVKLTVESVKKIICPIMIMQQLDNDIIECEPNAADFVVSGFEDPDSRRIFATEGLWWLKDEILPLVTYLHDDLISGCRAYQIQELMSRLTERFFVTTSAANGYISPFEEAVNSCNSHQRVAGVLTSSGGGGGGSNSPLNTDTNHSGSSTAASGGGGGAHQMSYLQIVKRTMLEHTGCTLGRIDLCYLRLLENYESIYGKGSCFATVLLLCKKRRFEPGVLNVDNHVHYLLLCPYLSGGQAGAYVKPQLTCTTADVSACGCDKLTSCAIANDIYPTLLPVHVAKLLPAWLAGRALQNPPRKCNSTSLVGWKILGLELNIAASQLDQSGYGQGDLSYAKELPGVPMAYCAGALIERICQTTRGRRVAPHLDFLLLVMLILLYAECGNPRAIHLIAKLTERRRLIEKTALKMVQRTDRDLESIFKALHSETCQLPFGIPVTLQEDKELLAKGLSKLVLACWILDRGRISKFVLLGDMIFRFTQLNSDALAEKVLLIYLSGEDLIRCMRVIRRWPQLRKKYEEPLEKLQLKYHLVKNGRQAKGSGGAASANCLFPSNNAATGAPIYTAGSPIPLTYNKDERLKESLAIVKRLAIMDDVDGAIDFFYKLRNSEGGLLDISVGNKILHLCVINGKLKKAEEILNTLRNDAHCEINAIDFIPGSCVRPDVVTCNIIIKGMARERGGHARLQEIKDFILHMEKPFHLGGDGVKPDQVTFHAVINAAVNVNDLPMAWDLFNMMLERNIKIDSFTCNLVAKQLSKGVAALHHGVVTISPGASNTPKSDAVSEAANEAAGGADGGATVCTPTQLSNMISKFCAFVEQNDITNYDDNVSLLSNIIDMYARKETPRLKKFLDNVSAKILSRENGRSGNSGGGDGHRNIDAQELAVLMVGYGKCGKATKVNMLWKLIEAGGKDIKWTTSIIGSCIEAFASIKDLNQVLLLAEKARKLTQSSPSSRPLTAAQYSAIIRTCVAHQKQTEALACYSLMKQYDLLPNEMAYNALIHSCVQAGDLNTALGILNEMGRPNHSSPSSPIIETPSAGNNSSNAGLKSGGGVQSSGQQQNTSACGSSIAHTLPAARPDIVTYSTIIKGLCDEGNMEAAYELFESLPAKGLIRDSVTYNTILEGYARAGNGEAVERVFSEMMTCPNNPCGGPMPISARPTCYTLTILVKFYGRKRQVDHVINLVEVLPALGKFKLDSYVYTAVIAACAWNNRIHEAYNYLLQMRQQFGCGSRTYGTLVSGCIKNCQTNILMLIIDLITQDKIRLDKREVSALRDLLKQYNSQALNPAWIQTGFNYETAEAVRQLVTQQRRELNIARSSTTTSQQ